MNERILLYTSGRLAKTRVTGGVKRFCELLREFPKYCELTLMSGDDTNPANKNVKFVSMKHGETDYRNEVSRGIHNISYIRRLRDYYQHVIVFDVPPALLLAVMNVPHMCLMVRKDLIGYKKQELKERGNNRAIDTATLWCLNLAESIVLKHCERVIVQCEYDKEQILARHSNIASAISRKIFCQINNINPSWVSIEEKGIDRTLSDSHFSIGCITSFSSKRKGCDIFLEAVKILIDEGYTIRAYIAGDGKLLDYFKNMYADYSDIIFLGRINSACEVYSMCDLAVVPSREDSCPNTLLEALINRTPVIGANRGGIPELLQDNEALFLPDTDSLAEKIKKLMDNKNELRGMSERQIARREILTFDWGRRIFDLVTGKNNVRDNETVE